MSEIRRAPGSEDIPKSVSRSRDSRRKLPAPPTDVAAAAAPQPESSQSESQPAPTPPRASEDGPAEDPPAYGDEFVPPPPAAIPGLTAAAPPSGGRGQAPPPRASSESEQAIMMTAAAAPIEGAPPAVPGRRRRRGRGPQVDSPEKLNWMIHLAYVQKDYTGCKTLVEHQLKETAGNCEYALYVNGLLLRHVGKMEESLEYFQKAMHLNPHHKDNAKQVARSLFLMSRHRAAIAVYEQILVAGVRDWHVLHNMGVCYSYTDNLDLSEECLEQALELHKHDVTYLQLGKVLLQRGDVDKAVKTYETALSLSPENSELLTTLGLLHMENGNTRKAFDLFGSALTYDPRDPKAVMGAGSIIQTFEDFDVALIKYRVTAVRTPESAEMWNNIGMCFFGKGKLVAAIACLKKAVYLAPAQWKISYNLGLVHMHNTQYVSAFHFLSAAINFKKDHALSFMLLGTTLMYLDDAQNGKKAFEKAVELDNTNPLIYINFSALLYNEGDLQAAGEQHSLYQRCAKANPTIVEDFGASELGALSEKLFTAINLGIPPSDKSDKGDPNASSTANAEPDPETPEKLRDPDTPDRKVDDDKRPT